MDKRNQEFIDVLSMALERIANIASGIDAASNLAERVGGAQAAYTYARREFDRIFGDIEHSASPTESLHEMAKRMCDSYHDCEGCPLDSVDNYCAVGLCAALTAEQMDAQFETLRKWDADHPPKPVRTYRDDFFEKFPDAQRDNAGYPVWHVCMFYKLCSENVEKYALTDRQVGWDRAFGSWEATND